MKTPIVIGGQKIGRLRASFLLFKESWRFLRADAELLLVPVLSLVFTGLLLGLFTLVYTLALGTAELLTPPEAGVTYEQYGYMFGVYIIGAFSLALSQATMVHIVYVRAHGGNATLWAGLSRAWSHAASLLIWAVITSTVGLILRVVSERSQLLGRIVAGLLGTAWAILTFFVIPIIVLDKKTAFEAVGTSGNLFKKTWGETLVANITLGAVFVVAHLVVLGAFIGLLIYGATINSGLMLIIAMGGVILWLIIATLVNAALQGILKTLLYIYAAEAVVPPNFNRELLEGMLVRNGGSMNNTTGSVVGAPQSNTLV